MQSLPLTACGSSDSASSDSSTADAATSGDTLKIGLVAPISGDNGQYGTSQKQGYELAIKEINEAGGVNGKMLELETYDDQGDAQKAAAGAQKVCR